MHWIAPSAKDSGIATLEKRLWDTADHFRANSGLPRAYTPEIYQQKCSELFEHVYGAYPEKNSGVYAL